LRTAGRTGCIRFLAMTSALVILGCTPDRPTSSFHAPRAGTAQARVSNEIISLDEQFASMADEASGFAGMYYGPDGHLVVRLRSRSSRATIRTAQGRDPTMVPQRARLELAAGHFVEETAQFDFRQLLSWKQQIYRTVPLWGVVAVDIDEVENQIHFAVRTEQDRQRLMEALKATPIPGSAYRISSVHTVTIQQDLDDRFRPIPGGVRIGTYRGYCTLTANIRVSGEDYFLTSSHCSYRFGDGGDGSYAYQDGDPIGQEIADPDLISPGSICCPDSMHIGDSYGDSAWVDVAGCRFSDAALFAYGSGSLSDFGTVARTTRIKSRIISTSNPRFTITGASLEYPLVGTDVELMGSTSGWLTAAVDSGMQVWPNVGNTCADFFGLDRILRLCQVVTAMSTSDGDSGGPLFTWSGSGNDIELVGIHVGVWTAGAYFSPWLYVSWEVEAELGPWDIAY